jgi:hypothetical protein
MGSVGWVPSQRCFGLVLKRKPRQSKLRLRQKVVTAAMAVTVAVATVAVAARSHQVEVWEGAVIRLYRRRRIAVHRILISEGGDLRRGQSR